MRERGLKMSWKEKWMRQGFISAAGFVSVAFCLSANAQVQSNTQTATGQASKQVSVERATVEYVSGNDLVVKMSDGTVRHISNVPESARVTVGGRELGIHDLKPGMTLERTITTTTIL